MRTASLVLLVLVLLAAVSLFAFEALKPDPGPDGEFDLGGGDALRPDRPEGEGRPATIEIREEAPPAAVAPFDEAEFRRLQGRGGEAVHVRDVRVDLRSSGTRTGSALLDAVSSHVPVRIRGAGARSLLEGVELPPHFHEEAVPLQEVLDLWRAQGLEIDDGTPVLVIGAPGS